MWQTKSRGTEDARYEKASIETEYHEEAGMKKETDDLGGPSPAEVDTAGSIAEAASHAAHTPGPWFVTDADHSGDPWVNVECDEWVVARVWADVAELPAWPNAHLIAAAPELYEALKGVTPICDAVNELIDGDEDVRARFMALLIKHGLQDDYGHNVAVAIQKAEGH